MKRNSETILNEWLIINCQMGDERALEELLRLWYPKLKNYAHKFIADKSLIDDVVQNTLIDMSKAITKLNDPAAFPKWLYQMLQNKCADAIRIQTKHQKLRQSVNNDVFVYAQGTCSNEVKAKIDISALDVGSQQLLYLHYYEEFSLADVSQILSIPAGTIKSRLFTIRQKLRESYNGDNNE